MSYDFAVWVGERPASDDAALEEFERLAGPGAARRPPNEAIRAFVADLTQVYPERTRDGVWAFEPLLDASYGDLLILNMTVSDHLDDVVALATRLARQHRLVAFDPQFSEVV